MARQHQYQSFEAPNRGKRIAIVGIAMIIAALLAFALAIRPAAYAEGALETQRTGELAAGQFSSSKSATVLVYMNGSDLESEAGEATSDIAEMLESGIGANANVVIETLGTSKWQNYNIASDHTQRYIVNQGKLELVDDSLGQLDTTSPDTLSDFIRWGVSHYPADRYILLFWDHGAGPVYGFGYDEFQSESAALTLDEMQQALKANSDVHFDIIGMDCCIMGSLETCVALQPYCDYTILSEDFEPGIGWSYKGWMSMLEQNPKVDSAELGKVIVNDMIADVAKDKENGEATLALIDESAVDELYAAWVDFAYENKDKLLESNYSQEVEWRDRPGEQSNGERAHGDFGGMFGQGGESSGYDSWWDSWDSDESYVTMTDYFVTDIMQVAGSIDSAKSSALQEAFDKAMVHYVQTEGETGMGGLGVTLPYGDAEFYDQLESVFKASGIDSNYVDWLEAFVEAEGVSNYYDFSGFGGQGGQGYGYGNSFDYDDYAYSYGYGNSNNYSFNDSHDYGFSSHSSNSHGFSYQSR